MFTDIQSAKDFARRLKFALRKIDPSTKLHTCQLITAKMCTYNDWHHLEQVIPIKPHLPDRATVVGRLQQELSLIGLNRHTAALFGEALCHPDVGANAVEAVGEVIVHPNGDFLIDASGDDEDQKFMSSYVKSGLPQVLEYRHDERRWFFKLIPLLDHFPTIVIVPRRDRQILGEIENLPEIIKTALDCNESWFDEKLLAFARFAGWDISSIRPSYTDEAAAAVLSEADSKLRHASVRLHKPDQHTYAWYLLIEYFHVGLSAITENKTILTTPRLEDNRRLARCFIEGDDYERHPEEEISHEMLVQALNVYGVRSHFETAASILLDIDPAKLLVSDDDHMMAPFHFLPSEHGHGCQPTLYGWPGNEKWKAKYSNFKGIALKPPYNPDNLAVILAQKHFEECGVVFLDIPQAQEYLASAAHTAHKFGADTSPHCF